MEIVGLLQPGLIEAQQSHIKTALREVACPPADMRGVRIADDGKSNWTRDRTEAR
jgi:hypothetical protein